MSASRGSRSRESRASPSERRKNSKNMSSAEKKFLRTLLRVLEKVVDENGEIANDDDPMAAISDESDSESEVEMSKEVKGADAREKSIQPPLGQATNKSLKRDLRDETNIGELFQELQVFHRQLTDQIRNSLNALGGGARTAKALQRMQDSVAETTCLFFQNGSEYCLWRNECVNAPTSWREAASEVAEGFKELGMFNLNFFNTLDRLTELIEIVATKLDVEYDSRLCRVDEYMDYVFEPLIKEFDEFLQGLTYIAEKEIATIRNAQNFTSQRYLNLTTVATFLSSVTATTLKITTSDSGSTLSSVANTLWLISLVFSTASAVYSLLAMTWRQSSVCQPNISLPSYLNQWFRNGPMYSLSAAVVAFSIGLCLLAFHVSIAQGGLASAIVPTAFAGVHAYAILLFSAWFLMEQWKARDRENGEGDAVSLTETAENSVGRTKIVVRRIHESYKSFMESGRRVLDFLVICFAPFPSQIPRIRRRVVKPCSVQRSVRDIELGQNVSPAGVGAPSNETVITASEQAGEAMYAPEAVEPDNALAIPEEVPLPESDTNSNIRTDVDPDEVMEYKYKASVNLLQFSPCGQYLASAFSDSVTVYDAWKTFAVITTIKTPEADQVKQIEWNPDLVFPSELTYGKLLVRSLGGIFVWSMDDSQTPNGHLVGHLQESAVFAKWISREDSGVEGFVCVSDCIIRLFNEKCEEVRSIDLSEIRKVKRIIHAELFREKCIICLANVPDDLDLDRHRLLVVNWREKSVDSERQMDRGHTSMIVSSAANRILCHGSEDGVEVADMLVSQSGDNFIMSIDRYYKLCVRSDGRLGHELSIPEDAINFHGKNDGLVVGYSSGKVAVLYRGPSDEYFSGIHIFTTPTANAILQNPISFAANKRRYSQPYMFAFGDDQGNVKVWSVQSERILSACDEARIFEVHDYREGRWEEPATTTVRFLTLQPGRIHEIESLRMGSQAEE